MKLLFWLALVLESSALFYFLYKAWKVPQDYSYTDGQYSKVLIPAAVLALIVISALLARFAFNAPKTAFYLSISPAIMLVLSMVGMMVASIFVGGKWH
jgi:hypothetical protein